jgi:hypothetical protein
VQEPHAQPLRLTTLIAYDGTPQHIPAEPGRVPIRNPGDNQIMSGRQMHRITGLLFALATMGCSDNPVGPSKQPEINNATNDFQFQITRVTNFSTNVSYTWRNTGTRANVTQSSSMTAGTATLTIREASGFVVYTRSLRDNGTFVTNDGTTGNWRIDVAPSNAAGTLNFRVQRGG